MKILALDSTAVTATVALCENEKLLGEYTVNNGNTHSENLLPMIEHLLGMFHLKVQDMNLLACSAGPGSFTGVRIGASTIKGMAFGTGIPCIGVSTLDALARNLINLKGLIVPVMNARRGQVYTALFRSNGQAIRRITEDAPLSLEELKSLISGNARKTENIYFCGDGYQMAMEALASCLPVRPVDERLRWQSAYQVAQVAYCLYNQGVRTTDLELVPTYLRPSQAERERNAKGAD